MLRKTVILVLLVVWLSALGGTAYLHWRQTRFDELILGQSIANHLDFLLVKALIHEESGFNPDAQGDHGEVGLMQVTSLVQSEYQNGRDESNLNLSDPAYNLAVGCWYLNHSLKMFKAFEDPIPLALARYNAGQSRVKAWIRLATEKDVSGKARMSEDAFLESIDIPSTRDYVTRILRRYRSQKFSIS